MSFVRMLAAIAIVASTLSVTSGAFAQGAPNSKFGSFSGTVTFTNDYVFRGYSLSNQHPAIQGSLDWSHPSGFNAGVWASNLDNSGDHLEMDWYAGYSNSVRALSYSATIVYYTYPWSNAHDEYWEGLVSAGYDFGFVSTSIGVGYSPKQSSLGHDDATWIYGDINLPIPLPNTRLAPYVFGHMGYQDTAFHTGGYWEWNGGVGVSLLGLDLRLMYSDTDVSNVPAASSRFVFSVSKSF
ncbi:MAG TPA: TorF family putative porin [Alphaproteobacteria bacterium]|nr:TorF family putative porin [Alphaproteobacteria bacterium]